MTDKIRLTAAQALVRFLAAQYISTPDNTAPKPLFAGVFAIFGHGNVAGLGEALYQVREQLPTLRAHNEQGMAHAAIAFAKANNRQQLMVCTSSVGPGATNMVTAAALAHANRLPVLFLPGDHFANRKPDPVLQQIENFSNPTVAATDCFIPVSRYFDRINRPEQLIHSLPVAIQTLLDPVNCGPVTLALPQDVQAEAFDYPVSLFAKRIHRFRRPGADEQELADALTLLLKARKPLIIAGGGVHYSGACRALAGFAEQHQIPVAETQAGKGALPWQHPCAVGGIGVTGSAAANQLAAEADLILAVGSRLQDFTTQSRTGFAGKTVLQLNIGAFDAAKHQAIPLVGDAALLLTQLDKALPLWQSENGWLAHAQQLNQQWQQRYDQLTTPPASGVLPSDAQVLGAVKRQSVKSDVIVCAAGGLPGELHKLWRTEGPGSYHVEYGFSCMGYEIAGGLGVKLAQPEREVIVVVGDGSYLMLNSELATSVMLKQKIIVVLLDNRGFGCINRLQRGTGNTAFNNLWDDCADDAPDIDFAAHAKAQGALSERVANIGELEQALQRARTAPRSYLIEIKTDPQQSTDNGTWWDVAIPQISGEAKVQQALDDYQRKQQQQPY
ncbi:3D-(3,5/4)-trihydroxycyclohexane-1,2-dione acylhydrolase (decyclizing) [Rheinheimera pacifica]|uniref:3D-(3,5/4)-trihydroxycyclohexane-1,2-dione acylhydrolase (decyclizing) n=1 Tax=Rheinheimera pacifica TaxID=173990 RepID=UPI002169DD1C|nr:3D-(3,5/4)-trihydroxycyclohexane-1,2-dione acylhydrolase (decyclizing) [Rheinheimera pacifica]MCS4308737.1 3D-(3,5/4)-trihydroxycyclohexane-1,2-dione acylhydrolase (decyclizing) [Rheinheimera pacifica]